MGTIKSGIYAIRNTVSGSLYVGSAVDIPSRWKSHRHTLRKHGKAPPKLQQAWDKYGESAFVFEVLEHCSKDQLLTREQHYLDLLRPRYNTRPVAESNAGIKWSKATNKTKGRSKVQYTVQGITGSLHGLAQHFGLVTFQTARYRINKLGWTVEQAVTAPPASASERGTISSVRRKERGIEPKGADLEFRGVRASLKKLVEQFSPCDYYTVRARRQRDWPLEAALMTPPQETNTPSRWSKKNVARVDTPLHVVLPRGELRKLAAQAGVKWTTLYSRLRGGWSLERAVSTPVVRSPE
jgi:hypothetical protein